MCTHFEIRFLRIVLVVGSYIKNVHCTRMYLYLCRITNNIRFKSYGDFGFGVYILSLSSYTAYPGWVARFSFRDHRQLLINIETLPFTMLLLV